MSKHTCHAALMALVLAVVMACSAIEREHGYIPSEADLEQVVIGVDTQQTLVEVIGIPQARGLLADGSWYYIKSRVRAFGPYEPEVVDREMLAISFADDGTVSNIERYGLEDGRIIALNRRVTALPVKGPKLLSQVFGSFGNFNAGDIIDSN